MLREIQRSDEVNGGGGNGQVTRAARHLTVAALFAVGATMLWFFWGSHRTGEDSISLQGQAAPSTPAVQPAGSIPLAASVPHSSDSSALSPSEMMRKELIDSSSFLPIYQSLLAIDAAQLEPFEQFYLAFILETCHFASTIPIQAAQHFSTQLEASDADSAAVERAKRHVSRRNITAMCAGIPVAGDVGAMIGDLYAAAAERGDPRALAWVLQQTLDAQGSDQGIAGMRIPAAPDESQRNQLLEILSSRDPMAITFAGRLLTRGYSDFGIAFGPEQTTPSLQLQNVLWELLACEHGANCGSDRLELMHLCATGGRCGVGSYQEHLRQTVLTPQDWQDFARIYPYINEGIRNGNWNGIHFLPTNPAGYIGAGSRRFGLGG